MLNNIAFVPPEFHSSLSATRCGFLRPDEKKMEGNSNPMEKIAEKRRHTSQASIPKVAEEVDGGTA